MRPADDTAERTAIDCRIVSSTAQAIVIDAFGRNPKRVTLPLGLCRLVPGGGLIIPEWLARDRGLL
jgi:hypothetical protein